MMIYAGFTLFQVPELPPHFMKTILDFNVRSSQIDNPDIFILN